MTNFGRPVDVKPMAEDAVAETSSEVSSRQGAALRLSKRAVRKLVEHGVSAGLRLVNRPGLRMVLLDENGLLSTARRRVRAHHFEDMSFLDGLRYLLLSLQHEADLNLLGRIAARENITGLLANRLCLERDRRRHPEIAMEEIRRPLFITGLPRTGSTLLHGLLAQDPTNRVPENWEMLHPSPPPDEVTYDDDPRIRHTERQIRWFGILRPEFRKIHPAGARLPEECVMILAHSFLGSQFCSMYGVPSYQAWLDTQDFRRAYRLHRYFLQHLQWRYRRERWVLKAPTHMRNLEALFSVYPDAGIIMTHREPLEVLASEASLQVVLRRTFSDTVDPLAVGREAALSMADAIGRALRARDSGTLPDRFLDVWYPDLLNDPMGVVRRIYRHFDLPLTHETEERMRHFLAVHPKDKYGPHEYTLEEFGLDADEEWERHRGYRTRFVPDVPRR